MLTLLLQPSPRCVNSHAFDHPTPTSFSQLQLLSSSVTSNDGSDYTHRVPKVEEQFCSGFNCCGLELDDLVRLFFLFLSLFACPLYRPHSPCFTRVYRPRAGTWGGGLKLAVNRACLVTFNLYARVNSADLVWFFLFLLFFSLSIFSYTTLNTTPL